MNYGGNERQIRLEEYVCVDEANSYSRLAYSICSFRMWMQNILELMKIRNRSSKFGFQWSNGHKEKNTRETMRWKKSVP